MSAKKNSLTTKILISMGIGIILGVVINLLLKDIKWIDSLLVGGLFTVIGEVFVSALKMMVVPLVLISLTSGVTKLGDVKQLGRIGLKAISFYLVSTAIAISIALGIASVINPGSDYNSSQNNLEFTVKTAPSIGDVIINMVPSNPINAMVEGNMLQIIVFAILFGVAITLSGKKGKHVLNLVNDLDIVILKMVNIVMKLAPVGVFALITKVFATQGLDIIMPLAGYFFAVVFALLLHFTVTFSLLLKLLARLNPIIFYKKIKAVLLFAFSTASSNATIPVTLTTVEEKMGVDNKVASFTIPLGATINMDGTAIMQGVATVFIANIYGITLTTTDFLTVIITATLASIGTAGVPGVGLVMLAMVLGQVGLPVEGIALIIGVDRLLDMTRTAVNVTGDATISCIIAKSEKGLDEKQFNKPL